MEKVKPITLEQQLNLFILAVDSFTQPQIDAVCRCTGNDCMGWTKETLKEKLVDELIRVKATKPHFVEVMG
jgi:hypothetical protein